MFVMPYHLFNIFSRSLLVIELSTTSKKVPQFKNILSVFYGNP